MADAAINNHAGLIWSIADLLRGDYKQSEYGRVILPLVVLRRLDCVLEPTKAQVLKRLETTHIENVGLLLRAVTGLDVYNTSRLTLRTILADPAQVAGNLRAWIASFDPDTRDVIEKFDFDAQVGRLDRAKLLYQVVARVAEVDLHPDKVTNVEMGYLYEELVRRFSEASNETAGEHFTPREVIRLMVDLLFIEDDDALRTPGIVRTLLDPACGTGGMLSVAADYLRELNPGSHCAEGSGTSDAARRLGVSPPTVIKWRDRFASTGWPGSTTSCAAAGPRRSTLDPPPERLGVTHASTRLLAGTAATLFTGEHARRVHRLLEGGKRRNSSCPWVLRRSPGSASAWTGGSIADQRECDGWHRGPTGVDARCSVQSIGS